MAGFLALGNDKYIGTYTATQKMENGAFVEFKHDDKTATLAALGATDVYFISNEVDVAEAAGINTLDFRVEAGEFVRAHKPQAGEILVTTVMEDGLAEGDMVGITGDGKVGKTEEALFTVHEVTGEYGVPTARLLVL